MFVLSNCASAKDLSFLIHSNLLKKGKVLKKYNITVVKTCRIVVQSSPNVVKIVVNTLPAFGCHCDSSKSALNKVMFTLYRIGFCSVAKVAPVQCKQELMFCCGAENVPKRSQCEQKPYPSYNLQRSFLI